MSSTYSWMKPNQINVIRVPYVHGYKCTSVQDSSNRTRAKKWFPAYGHMWPEIWWIVTCCSRPILREKDCFHSSRWLYIPTTLSSHLMFSVQTSLITILGPLHTCYRFIGHTARGCMIKTKTGRHFPRHAPFQRYFITNIFYPQFSMFSCNKQLKKWPCHYVCVCLCA